MRPQTSLCFAAQCKDVPRTDFFKTSPGKQMSDSLARVCQQQNKQAIICVAKNEITKSVRNKACYQLIYIVKQRHKSSVNSGKSQGCMVLSQLACFGESSWIKLTCLYLPRAFLSEWHIFLNVPDLFAGIIRHWLTLLSVSFNLLLSKLQIELIKDSYTSLNTS